MDRRIVWTLVGALILATPLAARASAGDWSILGARTLEPGSDVISGSLGWPDFTMQYTHGVRSGFDVGGRFQLLWGVENRIDAPQFGIAGAVPLRWALPSRGKIRLLFHVDPGLRLYTLNPIAFGFQMPFGANLEFPVPQPVSLGLGADFDATFFFVGSGAPAFFFGPLIGPYFEYQFDPSLSFGIDMRFGAVIDAGAGGTDAGFGLRVQMMLAYRL